MVRNRTGTFEHEGPQAGLLVTLQVPTREIKLATTTPGFYTCRIDSRDHPRIQMLTIRQRA